jgi:hypothetical protein
VTVGVAITVVWLMLRASESGRTDIVGATSAPANTAADDLVRPSPSAEAPTNSAVTAAAPNTPATPSAAAAPLPYATLVTPFAQIFEAQQAQVPPTLAQREREFAAQSVDRTWAPGAASEILDRFSQANGVAFNTLHVECKSTMCRLEAVSPKLPGVTTPQFNVVGNSLGLREGITISDPSGTLYTVAYVWRDGMAPAPVRRPPPRAN